MKSLNKKKKKVCIFIGGRANYGTAKSAMLAIKKHPLLELQIVAGASALLDKYGEVVNLVEKDGFKINWKVHMIIEGSTPVTMAKTTGIGLSELSTAFNFLEPDVVLVIGDRHEVMAAAIAATYMNIRVAHIMGGEVSGTIDESTRHAITKFAHIHFPASPLARDRIIKMGENPKFVFKVGCPRIDEVAKILKKINGKKERVVFEGVGDKINFDEPFLFVSQHPVTTEFGDCEKQINETLKAIVNVKMPTIMLWPNNDAGGEDIARGIRKFREKNKMLDFPIHFFKNLPMDKYFYLMNKTSCMIGNSSSLVREGSFIGTPAVLIGTRQQNRECADNLIKVGHSSEEIIRAVKKQISRGKAGSSKLYGDGKAGKRIADILAKTEAPIQKTFYM